MHASANASAVTILHQYQCQYEFHGHGQIGRQMLVSLFFWEGGGRGGRLISYSASVRALDYLANNTTTTNINNYNKNHNVLQKSIGLSSCWSIALFFHVLFLRSISTFHYYPTVYATLVVWLNMHISSLPRSCIHPSIRSCVHPHAQPSAL